MIGSRAFHGETNRLGVAYGRNIDQTKMNDKVKNKQTGNPKKEDGSFQQDKSVKLLISLRIVRDVVKES